MPSRVLREGILTSKKIALLDCEEELFYRRLMSVVDDFGRYHADPMLLRAACYPLKLNKVTDKAVAAWLAACQAAGLLVVYQVNGEDFVEITNFGAPRAKKSKFPNPPAPENVCIQTHADVPYSNSYSNSYSSMSGTRPDVHPPAENPPDPKPPDCKAEAREILEFLNTKTGRAYQPVEANLDLVVARLKEGATAAQCRQVIAKKAREWLSDEKMAEYLRPATLFNRTKFAQYVGELVP